MVAVRIDDRALYFDVEDKMFRLNETAKLCPSLVSIVRVLHAGIGVRATPPGSFSVKE